MVFVCDVGVVDRGCIGRGVRVCPLSCVAVGVATHVCVLVVPTVFVWV